MGVYHLMGLGLSPGTVIGPLTYLAHRYQRWNHEDQAFFAGSGEAAPRQADQKVGDIQALVLFTTREILQGDRPSLEYIENPPGRVAQEPLQEGGPMKEVLRTHLRREWPAIAGGRTEGTVFWCEVDRRDIRTTYERVARVVAALAGVGGQGKEMWINLTGGNNVMNFALELAAILSGDVARLYYVQAADERAEKCLRFTAEDGYWVDLPILPLGLGRLRRAILEVLTAHGPLPLEDLYARLRNEYWDLSRGLDAPETLRREHLTPLWKGRFIQETAQGYAIGPQWELIQPYLQTLEEARAEGRTIEQLCEKEPWIEQEVIHF
ncbi:hypothetical protein [Thermoflexus hugenholtzii]|uniref:Uncharacterized protein n=1 Tax=Thermoflexus hugenholtzii JAD2 TaxID=877466 RepID=A0A212RMJ9_9CHLR|nr:hypothetical protein [Thermoflexus hugenholtzii]SNB73770.1 hypothetical protein SAMN02746019_00019700 [Thermoflexus hugenholtzii JAD2]